MAEDGKVVFKIKGDDSELDETLDKTTTMIAKKTAKWTIIGQTAVKTLTSVLKKVGNGVKQLFTAGANYNIEMEKYAASLKTLLDGDTEAAANLLERLRDFSVETPLTMKGLAEATTQLYTYNAEGEDVVETLRMLGDIALGDEEKMNRLVIAYGQVHGSAKLYAQEANQMVNAGVPIWAILADYLDMSVAKVRKLAAESGIASETVTAALKAATEEGGAYYQAMANQTQTFSGQLERLKEEAVILLGSITEPFVEVAKEEVLPKANKLLAKFSEWVTDNKDKIVDLAGNVGDFVLNAMAWFIDAFQWCLDNKDKIGIMLAAAASGFIAIKVAVNPIGTAIGAVIAFGGLLIANWEAVKAAADRIWNSICEGINNAIIKLKEYLGIEAQTHSSVHTTSSGKNAGGGYGKKFASGGIVTGSRTFPTLNSGLHTVGEAGAEAILPLDTLWQHMGAMLDSRLGGMQGGGSYPAAQGIDYARLAAAMSGLGVYLNGERVGELIEPTVSDIQARSVESVQRSGYNGRV